MTVNAELSPRRDLKPDEVENLQTSLNKRGAKEKKLGSTKRLLSQPPRRRYI